MSPLERTVANYQLNTMIPAIVLSLVADKAKPKQVLGPDDLGLSVEKRFGHRPSRAAIIAAMKDGPMYKLWKLHGADNDTPHVELVSSGLTNYIESLRYVPDSKLVALETVGRQHFLESMEKMKRAGEKEFDWSSKYRDGAHAEAHADRLRDGLNFLYGSGEYRSKGRSLYSRKIDKDIDWQKWGAVAGIAALPLAILLWWLTR